MAFSDFQTDAAGDVSLLAAASPVTAVKTVDKTYAAPGSLLTYTITLQNASAYAVNSVVITDPLAAGTAYVPGSVTGAAGAPPKLTLAAPIPAGGSAVVSYQVKLNGTPNPNPVSNTAQAVYTYTLDPANPNGATGVSVTNTVTTLVNAADLSMVKTADRKVAYRDDVVTYHLAVTNRGNVPADNVVITDPLPNGTSLVANSLTVSVPYTGALPAGITLTGPVAPGQTVSISFQVRVDALPNPNPMINQANAVYTYTTDPENPDGSTGESDSNRVCTTVFRYNFSQQITDLVQSVALEQAALANLANAEGAKIQAMVAMGGVTSQELLCLNKSVADMLESISMLESVLKQKLSLVECQINGLCWC